MNISVGILGICDGCFQLILCIPLVPVMWALCGAKTPVVYMLLLLNPSFSDSVIIPTVF